MTENDQLQDGSKRIEYLKNAVDRANMRLESLEDVLSSDHNDELAEQTALSLVRETHNDLKQAVEEVENDV